jgi:hypothetical protein
MNIQQVTNEAWSFYLLKYALKAEPHGHLNLDTNFAALHLNVPKEVLQTYFALHMTRPISSVEVALYTLDIPVLKRSEGVEFVITKPPHLRMASGFSGRGFSVSISPIDKYMGRPSSVDDVTLYDYFRQYLVTSEKRVTYAFQGKDSFDNNVYLVPESKRHLVRYSDYHPAHNPEGFFYNLLLSKHAFRAEKDLVTLLQNPSASYMLECYIRGHLTNEDDLLQCISDYGARHLYNDEQQQAIALKMLSTSIGNFLGSPDPNVADFPVQPGHVNMFQNLLVEAQGPDVMQQPFQTFAAEFQADLHNVELSGEQASIFAALTAPGCCGMKAVRGVPGAGKTLLAKSLAVRFESQGKKVMLAASTGAAASRLSKRARTVHSGFSIPARGELQYLPPTDATFQSLLSSDVIIIDEYSMLTSQMFSLIHHRLDMTARVSGVTMSTKLIIFFGDPAQIPPVCRHRCSPSVPYQHDNSEDEDDIVMCDRCHITSHSAWALIPKYTMETSMRHATDPPYITFLNHIRANTPTQETIDAVLGGSVLNSQQDVNTYLQGEDVTV